MENHSSSLACPGRAHSTPNLKVAGICAASQRTRSSDSASEGQRRNLECASAGLVARRIFAGLSL